MPTIILPVTNNEVRLRAELGAIGGSELHSYQGIVDTGAQMTGITPKVVEELGLESVGVEPVVGIEGRPSMAPIYRIVIGIGVFAPPLNADGEPTDEDVYISGSALKVMLLENWNDITADVLLGMDMLVDFHITMVSGRFILSN